ncbi:TerD family protein [Streptomyces marincola]|uniref:TerD family protein n=1 Tax=Streptomyces marincola TaxID=2878388 RepID=UPI001CF22586|nr:TerD family protein [Streptomyces marincola]UCM90616.1 TerD family protein [Streptomyces marincola]
MTAELIRGQNHPLPETRLEVRVSAGGPVVAGVTLNDEQGRLRDTGWIAHPASPRLPGVEVPRQAAARHRLAVDLDALPAAVHRVNVLLALPSGVGGATRFGALPAPFVAVTALDGREVASYTLLDLDTESAVVAVELYRRNGAWKVRAVGQGWAGGLAALLRDQGLPEADRLAAAIDEAVAGGMARSVAPPPRPADAGRARRAEPVAGQGAQAAPARIDYRHPDRHPAPSSAPAPAPAPAQAPVPAQASAAAPRPVAGDAPGSTPDERLYNQVWGMFEDLARTTAAYRSAVGFADSRMDRALDDVLADPRTRVGPAADEARTRARAERDRLVDRAREAFDRDVAQLVAEAAVVEPALPAVYARWDSPAWSGYRVPAETSAALRLGDLSLPERVDLRIPMLLRLPLQRGLWIDSGRGGRSVESALVDPGELRRLAAHTATDLTTRLLAAHPAGGLSVHVIDPAGAAAEPFAPLTGSGVLAGPPAAGAEGVRAVLARLTQRVDLVQMAVRSGAGDALPPDLDLAEQLLIVHDFPHGFDDRAVTQLRYLADEGPSVGVHLMMIAAREDTRGYGPVLDPLFRALLRLAPVPDNHLADPWVGHAWTYEPPLAPQGSPVPTRVLRLVAAARAAAGQ